MMFFVYREWVTILTVAFLLLMGGGVAAQNQDRQLDPAGYVNKYDPTFEGIGPEVYVLPAPRTRQEVVRDSYADKGFFSDTISRALDFQTLLFEFKEMGNVAHIADLYSPFPTDNESWHQLINAEQEKGAFSITAGIMNTHAKDLLQQQKVNQAIGFLEGALTDAKKAGVASDIKVLHYNLANSYLFIRNFREAAFHQEAYLRLATQGKTLAEQASAHVKLAVIQAQLGDYALAENTIIRKAVPLFNRAKDYYGKIGAWQRLAAIYQQQGKHTQAQWFLLQARDLARKRDFPAELAEIEYMLASSKMNQKNYKVALAELQRAKVLVADDNNELLELAIIDKLGDVHLILANYDEAESQLESYWKLRNQLFSAI